MRRSGRRAVRRDRTDGRLYASVRDDKAVIMAARRRAARVPVETTGQAWCLVTIPLGGERSLGRTRSRQLLTDYRHDLAADGIVIAHSATGHARAALTSTLA